MSDGAKVTLGEFAAVFGADFSAIIESADVSSITDPVSLGKLACAEMCGVKRSAKKVGKVHECHIAKAFQKEWIFRSRLIFCVAEMHRCEIIP